MLAGVPLMHVIDRGSYQLVLFPERPDWAATNAEGVQLLGDLARGDSPADCARRLAASDGLLPAEATAVVEGFAAETNAMWRPSTNGSYEGRAAYLRPTHLRELWIHINNRCNFSCRHCLVSSGPNRDNGLAPKVVSDLIRTARDLGVVTFFFTGGEPLLREDLPALLHQILEDPQAHAVVLTNGSLLNESFLAAVADLDRERLHLQVSLDGSTPQLNDALRSPRAFVRTTAGIRRALAAGINTTVATVVLDANMDDLTEMAQLLPRLGVRSWHLMWQHLRERGAQEPAASIERTCRAVLGLEPIAARAGLSIDNFESFKAIINGEAGTKRDGTNACWDSLAVYADGSVYPSAALVGIEQFRTGSILERPLRDIWLESPRLAECRERSVVSNGNSQEDPFFLLHGGGDPEHAHFYGEGRPDARDPYLPLYRDIMLHVADEIVHERMSRMNAREHVPVVYHAMGQDGLGCPVDAGVQNTGPHRIDFTHSNCVLMQDVVGHSRQIVQDYYGEAAVETKGEICCPVPVDRRALQHIPKAVLERSYGCGSPVFAADVQAGETVVDLGSGGGVECFAAAKMVGPAGRVYGVDMTPEMLDLANWARGEVAGALGHDSVRFIRGHLEDVPLAQDLADLVISNCVINLSPEKFRVFAEIFRILKPGGRMVISDVTAASAMPEAVKYNPRLKGECIAGALQREELLAILTKLGFVHIETLGELPWRTVDGVDFFADTIQAVKPRNGEHALPYAHIKRVIGEQEPSGELTHETGCLVCGAPLQYLQVAVDTECAICGSRLRTRSRCAEGHFVCDQCHGGDYMRFMHHYLAQCESTDPVEVFLRMRDSYAFPVHGPEHHGLVPAAFLAAYHGLHGCPDWDRIWQAVQTGSELPGGTCAFWGACSAALGIGIAFSAILGASPLSSDERAAVQHVVSRILERVAQFKAPRCCRRESLISLQMACELSAELLPAAIQTHHNAICDQMWANAECIGSDCPFANP